MRAKKSYKIRKMTSIDMLTLRLTQILFAATACLALTLAIQYPEIRQDGLKCLVLFIAQFALFYRVFLMDLKIKEEYYCCY